MSGASGVMISIKSHYFLNRRFLSLAFAMFFYTFAQSNAFSPGLYLHLPPRHEELYYLDRTDGIMKRITDIVSAPKSTLDLRTQGFKEIELRRSMSVQVEGGSGQPFKVRPSAKQETMDFYEVMPQTLSAPRESASSDGQSADTDPDSDEDEDPNQKLWLTLGVIAVVVVLSVIVLSVVAKMWGGNVEGTNAVPPQSGETGTTVSAASTDAPNGKNAAAGQRQAAVAHVAKLHATHTKTSSVVTPTGLAAILTGTPSPGAIVKPTPGGGGGATPSPTVAPTPAPSPKPSPKPSPSPSPTSSGPGCSVNIAGVCIP
jgi:hypothetical protein